MPMESNGNVSDESSFGLDLCNAIIKRIRIRIGIRMRLRASMIIIIKRIKKVKIKEH